MSIRMVLPIALCGLFLVTVPGLAEERGYIGVQIKGDPDGKGVKVEAVLDESPAAKAGVQADDLITEIDGAPVTGLKAFVDYIGGRTPGDEVTLKVLRKDKEKEIKIKVGKIKLPPPPEKKAP